MAIAEETIEGGNYSRVETIWENMVCCKLVCPLVECRIYITLFLESRIQVCMSRRVEYVT